jgi:hypothetical protein
MLLIVRNKNNISGIIHLQVVKIIYKGIINNRNLDIKMLKKRQKNLYKKCCILLKITKRKCKFKWIKKSIKLKHTLITETLIQMSIWLK